MLFSFCLFVLTKYDVFVFVLSYFILLYFSPLEGCLLSNVRLKGGLSRQKRWGENWRRRGRENYNLDLLCQEKNLFSKRKRLNEIEIMGGKFNGMTLKRITQAIVGPKNLNVPFKSPLTFWLFTNCYFFLVYFIVFLF